MILAFRLFMASLCVLCIAWISSYSEVPGLHCDFLFDNVNSRDTVYNYILTRTSNTIMQEIQVLSTYDISNSTLTGYGVVFFLRLDKQSIREELLGKIVQYKNALVNKVIKGIIKRHRCFNDMPSGYSPPCEEDVLWQK